MEWGEVTRAKLSGEKKEFAHDTTRHGPGDAMMENIISYHRTERYQLKVIYETPNVWEMQVSKVNWNHTSMFASTMSLSPHSLQPWWLFIKELSSFVLDLRSWDLSHMITYQRSVAKNDSPVASRCKEKYKKLFRVNIFDFPSRVSSHCKHPEKKSLYISI